MSIPFHASIEEEDEVQEEEAVRGEVANVDSDAIVGGEKPEVYLSEESGRRGDKKEVVDKKRARIEEEREKRR